MLGFVMSCMLATVLGRLAWIDFRTLRLPDIYTFPLIAAGLLLAAVQDSVSLSASVAGGMVAYGLFWAIGYFYFTRFGSEGLGLGDAKLFAASGTWLGVMDLPYVLLVASVGGLVCAGLTGAAQIKGKVAFGPWLCLGFFAVWAVRNI
jgi:leader peptidase (prepilin peptidase)/N-methyltransferase